MELRGLGSWAEEVAYLPVGVSTLDRFLQEKYPLPLFSFLRFQLKLYIEEDRALPVK